MSEKRNLILMSAEGIAPRKKGKIDVNMLKSISDRIAELLQKRLRVIAVVGGGALGEEYSGIAKKFSRHSHPEEIKSGAAEVNALLLIAVLRKLKIPVNSYPVSLGRIEEFLANPKWKVAVVKRGDQNPVLTASTLAKKYHAGIVHYVNTDKVIDASL
jgi:uridylate kinase